MKRLMSADSPEHQVQDTRIVWAHRQIPMSYGRHVRGKLPLAPVSLVVSYESQLERAAIQFIVEQPGVQFIRSQPFTISYVACGKRRRYTPDLIVVVDPLGAVLRRLGFNIWTVVEVKPLAHRMADALEIEGRLAVAGQATGFATACLTERDIGFDRGGRPS